MDFIASSFLRDKSCVRCFNTSGGIRRASASCVIRDATSRRLRCSSARGGVHRASASRNCGSYIRGRVNHSHYGSRLLFRSLHLCKTAHHAPQRMVFCASPRWPRTETKVSAVAGSLTVADISPESRDTTTAVPTRQMEERRSTEQNSVTAIERVLAALEPEDVSVKDGLETVLRRAKDKATAATPSRAPVPEVTFESTW